MERVLIVGEHSYIGNSFEKYANKRTNDMQITKVGARNGEWKRISLADYDSILHVAAIVHKKETPKMQQIYQEVNTRFPMELAGRAKESGVKNFVFLSTMAVYGKQPSPIDDKSPVKPVTMYGKSKLAAEEGLERLANESFRVVILRPPMVYGKDCPGNYERLAKLAHRMPVFPKVKNQRSMIYIENLCACIYQEMRRTEAFRIICPQNTDYVNTTDLVRIIRKTRGNKTLIFPFPKSILQLCIKKSGILEKVFGNCYYEHREEETDYQIVDFEESVRRTEIGEKLAK